MKRFLTELKYKWCMANAYLTQFASPHVSVQWERDADDALMDLWRFDRGLK